MTRQLLRACTALALAGSFASAQAALINAPLPDNAYITQNGLDWAWGSPLPASAGIDLSVQGAYGWRLPTLEELAMAPLATDFIFDGANVPLGGTDAVSGARFTFGNSALTGAAACAAAYFSNTYRHCDWQDGKGQLYGLWAGDSGAWSFADQLLVRIAASSPDQDDTHAAIPEPATAALLGVGLLGLCGARRRRVRG
ncbi:PEP-CTERM sorting domain-containing protein [Noviherbaspirillum massiliense]|uniref:PEP-CTERM sorting domain-containing protein n=1 Tax=Noviherbaspirillum massiliense TaxID=1465823 RepID=UPI0002DE6028|nr:PEP-CTERM sorting domain-containing protein [Noviherbaspirillum massiliense]